MSFKEVFTNIETKLKDISQLNVRTFTGEIEATIDSLQGDKKTMAEFLKGASVDGTVNVVGVTDMKIDGDIDQFITSSSAAESAIDAHSSAVQTAQQARQAILDLFASQIRNAISKINT